MYVCLSLLGAVFSKYLYVFVCTFHFYTNKIYTIQGNCTVGRNGTKKLCVKTVCS